MKEKERYLLRGKSLITMSIALMIITVGLVIEKEFQNKESYQLSYEYVNVKDMAAASVSVKNDTTEKNVFTQFQEMKNAGSATAPINTPAEESSLPLLNNTAATIETPKQLWYLPVEYGNITTNPNYSHVALDITSPRGSGETIYPVANGIISGIYTDGAGAKIITLRHIINGITYTSQYVHLSSYAPDLYIGKEVTINDYLGKMGTTGRSTGVHLHVTVLDCSLFDPTDSNCADLNGFFRYGKIRYNQGFIGLGSVMQVPGSWTNR